MTIPTFNMLWATIIITGMAVLVASGEMNTTSSASPKAQVSAVTTTTTTTTPPPFAAVMDIFQAPLAAFTPKMEDKADIPMGRDQQSSAATPAPSNIFFKAGSGIGSAASSLTGWFNNRMIPQVLRPASTTTAAPEVVYQIVPNQQVRRKIILAAENRRKPLRRRPIMDDLDDSEENEEQLNSDDYEEDEENNPDSNLDSMENDEEDYYEAVQKRKGSRKTQKRPNRQYFYIEEEILDNVDDVESDIQIPKRKPQRKQQKLTNQRRKNPPKEKQQKRRKPLRIIQKPQTAQVAQNRPYQSTQVKRKRRPSTFELVPISPNQAINSIQKKKPTSFTQNNQQTQVPQFLNIPWSKLGLAGPPKEPTSIEQQSKPIIVQIPQQNIKRKRRPTKKTSASDVQNPKRKTLRGQLQNQSPVFSILSEDEVREIFKTQFNQPSQASNSPSTLDNKKNQPQKEITELLANNSNDTEQEGKPQAASASEAENQEEDSNNAFIVVGPADDDDDKETDLNLYRHYDSYRGYKRGIASARLSHNRELNGDDYDE